MSITDLVTTEDNTTYLQTADADAYIPTANDEYSEFIAQVSDKAFMMDDEDEINNESPPKLNTEEKKKDTTKDEKKKEDLKDEEKDEGDNLFDLGSEASDNIDSKQQEEDKSKVINDLTSKINKININAPKVNNNSQDFPTASTNYSDGKDSDYDDKTNEKGSKTMARWLKNDQLIVHPVWIGNLPKNTTVNSLRKYVESKIGRVFVSIHISSKQQNNERTYAFLNLPTAEKQLLAVTLLDGKYFDDEKLIVRSKRLVRDFGPSKFPQSFFGSSPISDHFKHFRDCVVPAILANPQVNLNVTSVRKILEHNSINLDYLPNRVWCVQCTLVPQCHRTYCSFYHSHQEKELGRIISILAAQSCSGGNNQDGLNMYGLVMNNEINNKINTEIVNSNNSNNDDKGLESRLEDFVKKNANAKRSKHTLLIQGLPRSITPLKIQESFEVFGEIDNVIVNPDHLCFVRMKRGQDAKKIVHLFKCNNAGIGIAFAPYTSDTVIDTPKHNLHDIKSPIGVMIDNTTMSTASMSQTQQNSKNQDNQKRPSVLKHRHYNNNQHQKMMYNQQYDVSDTQFSILSDEDAPILNDIYSSSYDNYNVGQQQMNNIPEMNIYFNEHNRFQNNSNQNKLNLFRSQSNKPIYNNNQQNISNAKRMLNLKNIRSEPVYPNQNNYSIYNNQSNDYYIQSLQQQQQHHHHHHPQQYHPPYNFHYNNSSQQQYIPSQMPNNYPYSNTFPIESHIHQQQQQQQQQHYMQQFSPQHQQIIQNNNKPLQRIELKNYSTEPTPNITNKSRTMNINQPYDDYYLPYTSNNNHKTMYHAPPSDPNDITSPNSMDAFESFLAQANFKSDQSRAWFQKQQEILSPKNRSNLPNTKPSNIKHSNLSFNSLELDENFFSNSFPNELNIKLNSPPYQ